LGLVACVPGEAVDVATAVPPKSTPQPTQTPTPEYPQSSGIFELVAVLPAEIAGRITRFSLVPGSTRFPDTLELVTSGGAARIALTDGQVTDVLALPDTTVIGLVDTGTVWLGTVWLLPQEGNEVIYALEPGGTLTSYGADTGWQPLVGHTRDLLQDADGHVWLATDSDVRRFDGTRWTVYSREDLGMPPPAADAMSSVFQVAYAPQTRIVWVGQCDWIAPGPIGGGGARWFDGTSWQGADSPAASGCVTEIVTAAADGRVWVALDQHLWQYNSAEEGWQQFTPPDPTDGPRIGYPEKLFLDHTGNPWPLFSLCGGASCYVGYAQYRLRDGDWTLLGDVPSLWSEPPVVIFGPENEPYSFVQGQRITYSLADEPQFTEDFELLVSSAVSDAAGNVWVVGRPSPDLPLAIWHATRGK
jgi:hypothetical protein